jgi:hypothetical protein
MRNVKLWALGLCAALVACNGGSDQGPDKPEVNNGPAYKGDAPLSGSCRDGGGDHCGGRSDGQCWCDDSCELWGNCCADRADVCGGGSEPVEGGLQYKSYNVLFTNPLCRDYRYDEPLATADGEGTREQKPKNVFCTYSDIGASGNRVTSPQYQIVQWLGELGQGDEVFLAYLSFSNRTVASALCDAAERGAKITFILDRPTDRGNELEDCGGTVLTRGHVGGIGYAHNKVLLINPKASGPGDADTGYMRMAFSSGNMSSGAVLHHENWHFIEVKRESYFADAHRCLMEAQLDEDASASKSAYRASINACREASAYPEETDIGAYFIPNKDDSRAISDRMVDGIEHATRIDIGAHRFGYPVLIDALADRLRDDGVQMRMVADDDVYWLRPYGGGYGHQVGDNMDFEAENIADLWQAGGEGDRFEVRYMETNHDSHLLHHNKFLIYQGMTDGRAEAVLCGAANLTGTGFWTNFENIYWVEIPAVVEAFKAQFARFWDGEKASPDEQDPPVATPPHQMPARDVIP